MKIKNTMIALAIFLAFCSACVPSTSNDATKFEKFRGSWKMVTPELIMSESWQKTNDTLWEGKSYVENNGQQELEETVQLVLNNQTVQYIVKRKDMGEPVAFTLINKEDDKFIFENKANDFPQQIIYHFKDDGSLDAAINGTTEKGYKEYAFPYKKSEN